MEIEKPNPDRPQCYWFPAKRYGYGWGLPQTWQGWIVFAVFLTTVCLTPFLASRSPIWIAGIVVVSSGILIGICYWKGEPPKWRWGG